MHYKNATMDDFDVAFDYIEKLWTYNTYDKDVIRKVYSDVIGDANSFAFFLMDDDGGYHGFCHGTYFNTFWLSGMTCYVSSIITNEDERGQGNGIKLMDHARDLAKEIVTLHHGTIAVTSKDNLTCFTVTLPLDASKQENTAE